MASLKVAVRVRPFNKREYELGAQAIIQMFEKKTRIQKPENASADSLSSSGAAQHEFTFDHSYWSFEGPCRTEHLQIEEPHIVSQEEVYNDIGVDVINSAFEGYNACIFAYGQTGSGKTFTMMGTQESLGLIPRICKEMFNRMTEGQKTGTGYKTSVSYLEIYNERVRDLLGQATNNNSSLRVREHRQHGPYVEGLSQHTVSDYKGIQEWINHGNIYRTTASTKMNDTSSRSHAIFTITFVQATLLNDMPSETVSKIHLVDLAGSERAKSTEASADRLKEGAHINKSLVSLGSVISTLADENIQPSKSKKKTYIPYRDSVLTWLLKDSLGGNSKTIMIATISPADCNYNETLSTLRYANRAKNIINKPTINEDSNVKLIRELREEILKLKGMISSADANDISVQNKSSQMLVDLLKKEAQEKVLTEEWAEKWRQTQSILREEKTLGLRKSGFGVVLDSDSPHLIGIHDGNNTGVTLYSLKEGETIIGSTEYVNKNELQKKVDILITGNGIKPLHCCIKLTDITATIYPNEGAQCWLNANLITLPQTISQGDILMFGRTNMFRYCNPKEAAQIQKGNVKFRPNADLPRLSLIAVSRENLNECIQCADTNEECVELSTTQLRKNNFNDIQEENRKMLETIENALQQLNLELTQIFEQYSLKVKILSEKLLSLEDSKADKNSIYACRGDLLKAKHEMLEWDKKQILTRYDIGIKQMTTLRLQLHSKRMDMHDLVSKELVHLKAIGVSIGIIEEYDANSIIHTDDILNNFLEEIPHVKTANSADRSQKRTEIVQIEKKVFLKEKEQEECIKEISQLDELISSINEQYNDFQIESIPSNDHQKIDKVSEISSLEGKKMNDECSPKIRIDSNGESDVIDQSNELNANSFPNLKNHDEESIIYPHPINDSEYIIEIPSYFMRGAGKLTHFEYEIRITLAEDKWIIMRRYSRFRELHISMKAVYGEKVKQIPFPSRELFASKSESVARNRRRQLESYLRRLIVVCSKIPQCPLYEESSGNGLKKSSLIEFSQFFKKGLFESGKYGTG